MSALLAWLALVSSGCLLYTGPINTAPTVSIVLPASFARDKDMTFTANATDDELRSVRFEWSVAKGKCPTDGSVPTSPSLDQGLSRELTFKTSDVGDFCVSVTVTDKHGATVTATEDFAVVDGPSVVTIGPMQVVTAALAVDDRVPLYSQLRFKVEATDPDAVDQGRLQLDVRVTPDKGAERKLAGGCGGSPSDYCFPVELDGPWTLVATVTDPAGVTVTAMKPFVVAPDQPPCISETNPPFRGELVRSPNALWFQVTDVRDDVDPLPAPLDRPSTLKFAWSWRFQGESNFTRVPDNEGQQFHLTAGAVTIGQIVEVRAEAHDSRPSSGALRRCADETQPDCCNQWATWTVRVL
jgi:hypothetical protein